MPEGSDARFIVRRPGGQETRLASVEELHQEVQDGNVFPDDELFDASTGQWAPARDVLVFRFIVDELELDGTLPEGLLDAMASPPPEDDAPGEEPDSGGELELDEEFSSLTESPGPDEGEVEGFVTSSSGKLELDPGEAPDPDEELDDPLGLDLDLVDEPDFAVPEPPTGASASPPTRTDEGDDTPPAADVAGGDPPQAPKTEPPEDGASSEVEDVTGDDAEDEEDDFKLDFGTDAIQGWGREWGDLGGGEEGEGAGVEPGSPEGAKSKESRSADSKEDAEDREWFTPHEEGGLAVEPVSSGRPGQTEDEAPAIWTPEEGEEAPSPQIPPQLRVRRSFIGVLALVTAAVVGAGWLLIRSGEPVEDPEFTASTAQAEAPPELPPPPPELEDALAPTLEGIQQRFAAVTDSLQEALELEGAPPRSWLSGQYLADAPSFPEVPEFWTRYGEFLEELAPRDRELYMEGVALAVDGALEDGTLLSEGDGEALEAYFESRYDRQVDFREFRYANLGAAARASLALHEVLARHGDSITYSPAVGGGVSVDPILEASIPPGPVRREVDQALDRVFRALDRSRGGGVPSTDGLQEELFRRFGEG